MESELLKKFYEEFTLYKTEFMDHKVDAVRHYTKMEADLQFTKDQVVKTNGRVNKLEKDVAILEGDNKDTQTFISNYAADRHDEKVQSNKLKMLTIQNIMSFLQAIAFAWLAFKYGWSTPSV